MKRMAVAFDVCIRGSGIVGHALALLLAQERLRVGLVAAKPAGPTGLDVRAYALNARSKDLLESIKCWPPEPMVTAVDRMDVFGDQDGRIQFSAARLAVDALTWIVDVNALEQSLSQAVRYQPNLSLLAEPAEASLTVICEGRSSALRDSLGVQYQTWPYPQRAIAARLKGEQAHGQVARQWFQQNEILALLPLGGAQGHDVALVWSLTEARAMEMLQADDQAFAQAVASASAHTLGAMTLTSSRQGWPLQSALAQRWFGRWAQTDAHHSRAWVLAGDAAHCIHPLAGQGLNLGLADAQELCVVLRSRPSWRSVADARLLKRYERSRRSQAMATDLTLNSLQKLFSQEQPGWQHLRNLGMQGFERLDGLKSWLARQAMGV